jgi:hypothetical protein
VLSLTEQKWQDGWKAQKNKNNTTFANIDNGVSKVLNRTYHNDWENTFEYRTFFFLRD